ncbi:COX15/CtaA family protein [Haloglycomyces albus]|uniref:COX15/CtaA family protein n=1 Tax=Haloglycomyces albus TaxID=526067 RepID=UPI000A071250
MHRLVALVRLIRRRVFATPAALRSWTLANVIANVGIILTGGAVRLTGSGLGCSEWPKCTEDSLVATSEMGMHGAIEFGNRLLTGILIAVAVGTWIAVLEQRPRRRPLILLSVAVACGIPAQAVIGGITVWTELNPWVVSLHFVVSMALVATATMLHIKAGRSRETLPPDRYRWVVLLGRVILSAACLTIALGIIVTASGPHAGDENARRTGLDPATMTHLHADAVWLLIGLTVAFVIALRAVDAPYAVRRGAWIFIAVIGLQGLIGYVQYYTGVPEILVGMHMLGSALLMIAVVNLQFTWSCERITAPVPPIPQPEAPGHRSRPEPTGKR